MLDARQLSELSGVLYCCQRTTLPPSKFQICATWALNMLFRYRLPKIKYTASFQADESIANLCEYLFVVFNEPLA